MRSIAVIFMPPFMDDVSGFSQATEQALIQAFISDPAVECLSKAVLAWLTWLDELQWNARLLRPIKHRHRREFSAVVTNYGLGWPA